MFKITTILYFFSLSFLLFGQEMQPITNVTDFVMELEEVAGK